MDLKQLLQLKKEDIVAMAQQDVDNNIQGGYTLGVESLAMYKKLMLYAETALKQSANYAINEIDNYDNAETKFMGVKVWKTNTGDRLDYDQDITHAELKAKLKERADLLKHAHKMSDQIYDSEGVAVPKVAVKTHGKEVISISVI